MEFIVDILIISFWASLFIAGVLGVVHEVKGITLQEQPAHASDQLDDDDPVFLMDTLISR